MVFPKDDADEAALERYQMAKSMGREYVVKASLMWAEAVISLPLQFVSQQSFSETKEESFESFGFQVCIHINTYTLSMHSISFLNP